MVWKRLYEVLEKGLKNLSNILPTTRFQIYWTNVYICIISCVMLYNQKPGNINQETERIETSKCSINRWGITDYNCL